MLRRVTSLLSTSSRFICSNVSNPGNFTLDSALKASTTGPDSVLSLLKSYGFTNPQISKIVALRPSVLSANPDQLLKPKLEYFRNMGISGPHLGKFISRCPSILTTSLDKKIVPSINYVRSLVAIENDVIHILERSLWVASDAERTMKPNITLLLGHGMPQCYIHKLLMLHPQTLTVKVDRFEKLVKELMSMGFSPLGMNFLHGLHVIMGMKKSLWDEKLAVFTSFGWSEDEVLAVFRRQPFVMAASAKKISLSLHFLMNDLKWTREDIARNCTVITLSLEKRVIPRCHVLQMLISKNLINKISMGTALRVTESVFLEKYVSKFHSDVPDLLKVYQSKMSTQDLQVGAEY